MAHNTKTSRRWRFIGKDVWALTRGALSIMVGMVAGTLSSGTTVNTKTILTMGAATLLTNIGQRLAGQSVYQETTTPEVPPSQTQGQTL